MLFANKPQTIRILDDWVVAADKECAQYKYAHPREQKCLHILKEKKYDRYIKIIPYDEINGRDGKWVRHYMGTTSDERLVIFHQHFQDVFNDTCPPMPPPQKISKHAITTLLVVLVFIVACFLATLKRTPGTRASRTSRGGSAPPLRSRG